MPFGFLNGALMWGSTLISVPILIHLLNRRRYRIIDWAAMEWLLQAVRQNKRRITIEQLILLALRCLIIFLIVLAVSKLVARSSGGAIGGLLGQKTDWVVVLDDSFTMGQSTSSVTCFDRARKEIVELVTRIVDSGSKDYFAVMLGQSSKHKLPAVPQVDRKSVKMVESKLEHASPSDLKQSPAKLLLRGIDALRAGPNAAKALVLVSDCRLTDWRLAESERTALKKVVDQAGELGIRPYLIDVGPQDLKDFANVAVVKLESEEKSAPVGEVAKFTAIVKNLGPQDVSGVPVKFTFTSPGGEPQPLVTRTVARIPAGGEEPVTESYCFKQAGAYSVSVEAGIDALPVDNARYLALKITEGIPVLLVDGEPGLAPGEAETFALVRALRPDRQTPSSIRPRVVDADALKTADIEDASVIFLVNTGTVSESNLTALKDFVRRGGGLAIFLGDQIDPSVFNESLYAKGEGIAPCRLLRAVGQASTAELGDEKFVSLSTDHLAHPLMAGFGGGLSVLIPTARFYRRFVLDLPKDLTGTGVSVVASYDDPDRAPAIIEKQIGKGKVVLITSSADAEWNTWMREMTYPVMMNLLVERLYTPASGARNLPVGASYTKPINLDRYEPSAVIEPPKHGGMLRRAAQQDEKGEAVLTFTETAAAGVYAVKFQPRQGVAPGSPSESVEYFAANLDTDKNNLRRPDPRTFRPALAEIGITYGRSVDEIWKATLNEGTNLWRLIFITLACCLAVESLLGWRFGHHAKQ